LAGLLTGSPKCGGQSTRLALARVHHCAGTLSRCNSTAQLLPALPSTGCDQHTFTGHFFCWWARTTNACCMELHAWNPSCVGWWYRCASRPGEQPSVLVRLPDMIGRGVWVQLPYEFCRGTGQLLGRMVLGASHRYEARPWAPVASTAVCVYGQPVGVPLPLS
jgi:hypothetical protein